MYIIYDYSLEDGQWLGAGEGLGNDLEDARDMFLRKAMEMARRRIFFGSPRFCWFFSISWITKREHRLNPT